MSPLPSFVEPQPCVSLLRSRRFYDLSGSCLPAGRAMSPSLMPTLGFASSCPHLPLDNFRPSDTLSPFEVFPSPPAASLLTPLAAFTAPGFMAGGSPLAVGSRPPPLRIAALRGCEPRPQGVPPVVSPLRLPPKRWRPLLPWALHLHGCRSCSTGFMDPLKRVRSAAERAMPSELVCTRPSRSTAARVLHHSQECT